MLWIFHSPLPWPTSYHPHHLSLFYAASIISLLYPLLIPYSPRRGATVHIDVAPIRQPPPLVSELPSLAVLNLLTRYLPDPGVSRYVPVSAVSLVRFPPLWYPQPAPRSLSTPRDSPFCWSIHTSKCLRRPPIRSPPSRLYLRTSNCWSWGVCVVFYCVSWTPVPCASASPSLSVVLSLRLSWWLVSLQVYFCVR